MVNRTMVRTRVIQTLFAYYKDGGKTPTTARKELIRSYSDTYSLYFMLLDFANELTAYAQSVIEENINRARIQHLDFEPNRRFTQNRWAETVFQSDEVRNYMNNQKLAWDAGHNAIAAVYRQLTECQFYRNYMEAETTDFDADKALWRKIYTELLADNEDILAALEDLEIALDTANWTTDMNVVLSYIVKTVKRTKEGEPLPILPMFDSEEELKFGQDLLQYALSSKTEADALINSHLKNWDADRVAYMDRIILQTAIAEILYFPNIALEVSLNEYIEAAKEYSSDRSHIFINGVLNEILQEKKRDGSLMKAVTIR